MYKNTEIMTVIYEYIHSERDRAILRLRYIDGKTYEKIAEEVDMSPRQIQNIVRKNRAVLFGE